MGRIMALDIGQKRTGIAVTDPLKMIATGLVTVNTMELLDFIAGYIQKEQVETFVAGEARQMSYEESESMEFIRKQVARIREKFPQIPLVYADERFTSKMALNAMKTAGAGKKQMKNKPSVDMVSATILLQGFMESQGI